MTQQADELTVDETAKALGVSRRSVARLVERGYLKQYIKPFGRPRVFFKKGDVQRLLKTVKVVGPKTRE